MEEINFGILDKILVKEASGNSIFELNYSKQDILHLDYWGRFYKSEWDDTRFNFGTSNYHHREKYNSDLIKKYEENLVDNLIKYSKYVPDFFETNLFMRRAGLKIQNVVTTSAMQDCALLLPAPEHVGILWLNDGYAGILVHGLKDIYLVPKKEVEILYLGLNAHSL